MSIGFDVPGDLDLTADGTQLILTAGAAGALQQIGVGVGIWRGGVHWDATSGLPILETILQKGSDLRVISQVFREFLLDTPGIIAVDSVNVALDRTARVLRVQFKAQVDDGTAISDTLTFPINV